MYSGLIGSPEIVENGASRSSPSASDIRGLVATIASLRPSLLAVALAVTLPSGMGRISSLCLCCLVVLASAAPADAAITASSISSPASGAELFFDGDSGSGSVTVIGTATGAGGVPEARGDLLCYTKSDTASFKVASGVSINPTTGSFGTTASLLPIAGFACRLAMVPAGKTPTGSAAAAFAGPAISVSDQFSHSSSGNLDGYFILAGTLPWSFAFQSVGECPINSSFATDEATLGSFSLFVGNSCLTQSSGSGAAAGTRSGLMIDGLNAYTPGAIKNLTSIPGFDPITYNPTFNAAHDTVTINETDIPMVCVPSTTSPPPPTFPPTTTSCPGLRDSGILIQQTTTLLPGGQVARVTQRFVSVDGHSHAVDALFSQSAAAQGAGKVPAFQFPGQGTFATQATPFSFAAFPPGPGSIFAISDGPGSLPATSNPIGAITYNRPPLSADFVSAAGAQTATFLMHYVDTVPAGGAVVYDWSYSQAATSGSLATLEQIERDRFANPSIVIRSPRNKSTVTTSVVRVQGQALDSVGVTSLSVAGHAVSLRAGGMFTTNVPLKLGANIIAATATNFAGNTATAVIAVTRKLPPCKVPKLHGRTLAAARRALRHNHCAVGKLKRVHSRTVRKGHVVASKPRAGSTRRRGAKVGLVLSRGR